MTAPIDTIEKYSISITNYTSDQKYGYTSTKELAQLYNIMSEIHINLPQLWLGLRYYQNISLQQTHSFLKYDYFTSSAVLKWRKIKIY